MKREKFDCNVAREYSIEKALAKLGYFPSRKTEKEAWYLSPFRSENQASFKVSLVLNRWYDHGLGKGGNVIDLISQLKKYSIPQVLSFLNDDNVDFSFQKPQNISVIKNEKSYEIIQVKELEHQALIDYLMKRCIDIRIGKQYCKEIHYKIKGKKYFAIAFKNSSNGYTIRNKFIKGNLLKKDITIIKNNSTRVCVFEGFIDFLSYLTLFKLDRVLEDFIVLNSVSSISLVTKVLENYDSIDVYLDNDKAGREATNYLQNCFSNVSDCSVLYREKGNDLNDYLIAMNVSPKR